MNVIKFKKLMNLIENTVISQIIVHTPTKEELQKVYEILDECGLAVNITDEWIEEKYQFGDTTGVCIDLKGVSITRINDIYSDYVWSFEEFDAFLEKIK